MSSLAQQYVDNMTKASSVVPAMCNLHGEDTLRDLEVWHKASVESAKVTSEGKLELIYVFPDKSRARILRLPPTGALSAWVNLLKVLP